MDKKDFVAKGLEKFVTDAVINALAEGKGNRPVGAASTIEKGAKYSIYGIDYRENWFAPADSDLTAAEIREMDDNERLQNGCRKQGWFTFVTNNGDLSFSAVLGDTAMLNADFWSDADKVEDFDISKIFVPSVRTPSIWFKQGCDGLCGKTLQCVATKTFKRGTFDVKARAFVIVE